MATEPVNVNKGPPIDVRGPISGRLPTFPLPQAPTMFATFSMDSFGITNTRALHNDTDVVYLSATVGANPMVFVSKSMGDVNNGTHSVGLSLQVDIPDDDTPVVFNYLILNNGHGGNNAVLQAAHSAMSTVAEAVIKNAAVTAAAVTIGTIVVPLVVSALAAVAAILGALDLASVLFADCDGVVAAGTLAFTGSDLIKRTASGQKILENTNHNGTDSHAGCGGNSQYSTACTIVTAPLIQTVLDLSGQWASGGAPGPFITRTINSISIDMSALHRPTATGSILNSTQVSVNFPDDKTYTAVLQAPNVIEWSNNSSWTKVAAITTVIDLNGQWTSGSGPGPVITVHGNSISIDMSALKRPTATGTVLDSSDISVNFPDDKSYTAVLLKPGTIRWSNNSTWTKQSPIKHLFVLVMENRSFDHLLGFAGITGKDPTGAATKAEDLVAPSGQTAPEYYNEYTLQNKSTWKYPVSPTAGDTIYGNHDVNHQFPDVVTQLCGSGQGAAVIANHGLTNGVYPNVAGPTSTGFVADYALNSDSTNPGEPMRCFARGNVPVLTALASEFVLCDHWFSAMAGPTEPNRMFVHAATSGVWDDSPTPTDYKEIFAAKTADVSDYGITFENGTIFEALRGAKVPFRIYTGDGYPQVGLLSGISLYSDIDDYDDFAADVANPTYDAAYTFIEPRYDTISQQLGLPFVNNSQHPANSLALGEGLIKSVYDAIRNSPHWNESMLIITWDEHGGFFDHVTPPAAQPIPTKSGQDIKGKDWGFMFNQYGLRVPAVVISPWCPQNVIDHQQREHSFIPATIEQLFGLKPLTSRDTGITGLHTLATLSTPRNVTVTIPNPIVVPEPKGPVPGSPAEEAGSGGTISSKLPTATTKVIAAAPPIAPVRSGPVASPPVTPVQSGPVASPPVAPVQPGPVASAPVAPVGSTVPLNLSDPWLASTLAVAMKAHIEAVPADAASIQARVFGLKTVGDLAQYYNEMTPIISNARAVARQQKVAARKQPVLQTVPVQMQKI
jgi:phospholipase C